MEMLLALAAGSCHASNSFPISDGIVFRNDQGRMLCYARHISTPANALEGLKTCLIDPNMMFFEVHIGLSFRSAMWLSTKSTSAVHIHSTQEVYGNSR